MLSFIEYLKRDSERIFDDTMSFNDIKDMPLLCYDGTVLKSRNANTQYLEHNDDAILLFEKEWCPENFVVLSKSYTEDFSSDMRQLFKIAKFDINNILNTILSSASLKLSVNSLEQSVDFWRWAKNNQKHIASFEQFNTLLLLDKNNAFTVHSELYISDSYQQDKIESLVTRYVSAAQFVSSSYLESNSDNEKAEWVKLFKKLGLKSDNKDILFSDILPNLATFEEDSVVTMMTKHLKDLKDNWAEICSQIIQLRVKTRSGQYKPLNQVVIINVDEDSMVEPFKYITHSDEVHPDILKTNKELLLLISEQYDNLNLISTKQKWIEEKIKNYLSKFNENEDSVADFHIQFVRELAKIQSEYNIDINLRKQIKYRTKNVEIIYKYADELTLGTDYSPICDFEGNGVTELVYLSNLYIFEGNKDSIKSYFRGEGMHNNMTREDLKYLSIRNFACYFWTNCFSRRVAEYEIWIGEGRFENIICIPTENSVQKAELLYSSRITAGYAVRAKVPQWEEKVPCKAIVDKIENREARELFEKLNFCTSLSFEDCLFYLARVKDRREEESDYRRMVISWILTAPNHDNELIAKYRNTPTSMWRNGKGQRKHISQLYAIHPDAVQERNIFWGNEYVMQTGCFPSNKESFEMVCKILQIKCLVGTDFVATPIGKVDETANMIPILRPRLLVLAAIENPEQFQQIYERYNDKLSQYHFYVCEKIDLGYDTIHNDVMRIYNDDTHVYYVSSWIHNRTFTKFCDSFKKLVGCYVDAAVSEDVLDINNTIEACIAKYCSSLAYNEGFISYLKSLDLTIDVQLEEDEEITIDDDYYSDNFDDAVIGDIGGSNDNSIVDTENSQQDIITDSSNSSVVHVPKHEQNYPGCGDGNSSNGKTTDVAFNSSGEKKSEEIEDYDTYIQIDSEDLEDTMGESQEESTSSYTTTDTSHTFKSDYDPDQNQYMGSIDKDNDFQPIGAKVFKPRTRRHPKNYTKEEVERLRSHGTPLELESLPATTEEIEMLAQCNISPEQIADTNYLAQLRLYLNITQDSDEEPEESMAEFVRNADDVTEHKLKNGRYIHTCSAARGVMYIGPTIWNKMIDEKGEICVYLNGQGKNFERIKNTDHFLKLVEKDDVVIKITGEEIGRASCRERVLRLV